MEDKKKGTGMKAGKPGKPAREVMGGLMKQKNLMNLGGNHAPQAKKK